MNIELVEEETPVPVVKKRRKRRKKPAASLTRWTVFIGKKRFYSDECPGLQGDFVVLNVEGVTQFVPHKGKIFSFSAPPQKTAAVLYSPPQSAPRFEPAALLGPGRHVETEEEREEYVETFAERQKRELELLMGPRR